MLILNVPVLLQCC